MSFLDTLQHVDTASLPGGDALKALRDAHLADFNQRQFPTIKDEDWKYTNLRMLSSKAFTFAASEQTHTDNVGLGDAALQIHFANGRLVGELPALPEGLTLTSLAELAQTDPTRLQALQGQRLPEHANSLARLSAGLFEDGLLIEVAQNAVIAKPIEVIHHLSGDMRMACPQHIVLLAEGAQAQLIERYISDDSIVWSNSATEITLAAKAELDYYLVQAQGAKAQHTGGTWVEQGEASRFSGRALSFGGQLIRNELKTNLNGVGAHADCIGLYVGKNRQHIDNHTTIRHAVPDCTSKELYKGIMDGRARGVFHGRIVVARDAQRTFSEQSNQNLLLSRDAEINTKPQLEIYADDVKCAHGATVGELDRKQVFYLQSRGIDKATAEQLLTYAFAADVLNEVAIPELKTDLEAIMAKQLLPEDMLQDFQEGETL